MVKNHKLFQTFAKAFGLKFLNKKRHCGHIICKLGPEVG